MDEIHIVFLKLELIIGKIFTLFMYYFGKNLSFI